MSAMRRTFDIIVAATATGLGIGRQGRLPWRLPVDMAYFKRITSCCAEEGKQNAVIMGRKTFQSIPRRFRPLSGRVNVVITRQDPASLRAELDLPDDVLLASSLEDALAQLASDDWQSRIETVFVVGGGAIYEEAVASDACDRVFMTTVHSDEFNDCDTFFPELPPERFTLVSSSKPVTDNGIACAFNLFKRATPPRPLDAADGAAAEAGVVDLSQDEAGADASPGDAAPATPDQALDQLLGLSGTAAAPDASGAAPSVGERLVCGMEQHEEMQYLNVIREIMDHGVVRGDRTGTGTVSKFGAQMRYSLRGQTLPALTSKRLFWRGVAEEMLWFISGSTNATDLQAKNIKIWDGNASREFLDKRGLAHREVGDLGPVYGFQWRHFGAAYSDMHADYSGQGVDQLAAAINTIKTNPNDRRILVSAWNPADLDKMALPPCHMFCQFFVANGELSCQMYQRSADMGLGVPFNIASYSLLTRLIAQVCGLEAGDFIHVIGDAHVYLNHVDALRTQLARVPRPFPKLHVNPDKTDIDAFDFSDLTLQGYKPHGTIKMQMAV